MEIGGFHGGFSGPRGLSELNDALKRRVFCRMDGNDKSPSYNLLSWQLGDSDKENWVPGTQMSNPRRSRRGASQMRRPVLREAGMSSNNNAVDDGKRERALRTLRDNANKQNEIKLPSKLDDEVKAFMSESGASSREEDLDCIQGLLSLSQGAWR
ncbi:Homeobox transcription factor [Rasamsonia emersonii CBS 393.64]|uniref:Homeobox transcription factor n=1 Tax=Rasamsonia emersonii (strain ATCC 16479 / CBS 393.64 / IMI 116815) TaxID=1408163 RepID=A0A0F4YSR7_RASE3|nr:Homeobox transcription factor [Rasamsonia emersonii CBS 393.64]KKA20663.1 Homeobox transcription factor [Rasamsonia emersonii CBS 393.64]